MGNKLLMLSMVIFPIFSAFLFVAVPNWSNEHLNLPLIIIGVDMIYAFVILLGLNHERFYVTIQFDLFVFFLLALVHRVWNGSVLLGIFLLICFAVSIFVGHSHSNKVMAILSSSTIGIAVGGTLGILIGKFFNIKIAMFFMLIVSCYILLLIHAAWKNRNK